MYAFKVGDITNSGTLLLSTLLFLENQSMGIDIFNTTVVLNFAHYAVWQIHNFLYKIDMSINGKKG